MIISSSRVKYTLWLYASLLLLTTATAWTIYEVRDDFLKRPFFGKDDQFHDLTRYIDKVAHLHHEAAALGPVLNYPAPAAYVYKAIIYTFPGHAVRTYICFLAVCLCSFALVAWRASGASPGIRLPAAAAIIATLLAHPLWYTIDRGNIEGVVWAFSAAGLCCLLGGRSRSAAVLIGLAASIKPFPILFLLLLVRRREYKAAALGVVTAGLAILAALTAIGPTPWKAYRDLTPGMSVYTSRYITNLAPIDEMRFDHSLLDTMKSAALTAEMGGVRPHKAIEEVPKLRAEPGGWHEVRSLVRFYPFVVLAGFALLFAGFYRMPILNQLTALGVALTLFPPSAAEYTLLVLYVPFGALLVFLTREVAVGRASLGYKSMVAFAIIYALLLSPLTPLMIYASSAKTLLLLALLVVAGRSPMRSTYFGDPADPRRLQVHCAAGPARCERIHSAAQHAVWRDSDVTRIRLAIRAKPRSREMTNVGF